MGNNIDPDAHGNPSIWLFSLSSIQFNIFYKILFISILYVLYSLMFLEIILDSEEVAKLACKGAGYTLPVFSNGYNLHNYGIITIWRIWSWYNVCA